MLSADYLHECFEYIHETGELFWRKRPAKHFKARPGSFNTRWAGRLAGSINGNGYYWVEINGTAYAVHRIIWAMHFGQWPEKQIDHINRNRIDNRLQNLRLVTATENCRNKSRSSANTSGVKGVCWDRASGKWLAQIKVDMKNKNLGRYANLEDARAAREAAERIHGYLPA